MSWLKKAVSEGKKVPEFDIRWMGRRDLPEVLNMEAQTFPVPWTEEDFLTQLRRRNGIGLVAEHRKTTSLVGYMVYLLDRDVLWVLNFAVDPLFRRLGLGTQMMNTLKRKLYGNRNELVIHVAEENLNFQLFARSQGLICSEICNDFYKSHLGNSNALEFIWKREWGFEESLTPLADGVDGRVANSF